MYKVNNMKNIFYFLILFFSLSFILVNLIQEITVERYGNNTAPSGIFPILIDDNNKLKLVRFDNYIEKKDVFKISTNLTGKDASFSQEEGDFEGQVTVNVKYLNDAEKQYRVKFVGDNYALCAMYVVNGQIIKPMWLSMKTVGTAMLAGILSFVISVIAIITYRKRKWNERREIGDSC